MAGVVSIGLSEDEIVALMVRNLGVLLMVLGFGCCGVRKKGEDRRREEAAIGEEIGRAHV